MKTKDLNKLVFAFIIDAICYQDFTSKELKTDKEKLQFLYNQFKIEYLNDYNLQRYGSIQKCFSEWLMGLPSSFSVPFNYCDIIDLAKSWKSIPQDATEKQEDKIINNYWNFLTCKTFQLFKKNNIQF